MNVSNRLNRAAEFTKCKNNDEKFEKKLLKNFNLKCNKFLFQTPIMTINYSSIKAENFKNNHPNTHTFKFKIQTDADSHMQHPAFLARKLRLFRTPISSNEKKMEQTHSDAEAGIN